MFKNKNDKKAIQLAMECEIFYYKTLLSAAVHNKNNEKKEIKLGKPPLAWQLSEKIFRDKGDNANEVAIKHSVSIAKVYKIWQGKQPGHVAYTLATGKVPMDDAKAYVEWVNVELSGN